MKITYPVVAMHGIVYDALGQLVATLLCGPSGRELYDHALAQKIADMLNAEDIQQRMRWVVIPTSNGYAVVDLPHYSLRTDANGEVVYSPTAAGAVLAADKWLKENLEKS